MSDDKRALWLASLKPGDKVAQEGGWIQSQYRPTTIEKITKKSIITTSGIRWNKDGQSRDGMRICGIVPITPEIRDGWIKESLVSKITDIDLMSLSVDQLKAVLEIMRNKA